ncbi:prolyl oligopeptidase family serine peptidase [Streptomyces sp. OF3]|uniref:Prolyl oligopeptidase family serine peptidase n=1 Tax=Streptomyces alkaliterrae TaxID=2213162 RepID=A0A7W3WPA3_9ACTN|nr:prolyl oligopeptidase family serine peptidase [Streptomyces alkaliterrae]MBB1256024.1 prolyl oligopeptidase family serine peptidase [Streptomyces alkaliterrae]
MPLSSSVRERFARQYARTRRFGLGVPRSFAVSEGGERVLFVRSRGAEDPVSCLWLAADGRETQLADPVRLGAAGDDVPEAERVRRERARERATGIVDFSADAAVRTAVFTLGGEVWWLRVDGEVAAPRRLVLPGPVEAARLDPTGRRVACAVEGAVHVVELEGDAAARLLAAPEHADVRYGLAEHVAAESMHRPDGLWWAPDGRRLLVARVDESAVRRWWLSDPADPASAPRAVRYPAAGTDNADVRLYALDLDGRRRTEVHWSRGEFEYLASAAWDAHGPLLSVQSRDQRTVLLLAADPTTGETRELWRQRDEKWVSLVAGAPARTRSGRLLHVEDHGRSRRLLVDGEPVTPDGLQVDRILGSPAGEAVYFAGGAEPTEEHVWRWSPGEGLRQLTTAPGTHTAHPAAGGGALVLVSRTEERLVEVTLRRAGRADVPIGVRAAEPLLPPRAVHLRAGAREVRTALLLPSWYRPGEGRRLPVLLSPYSGPAMRLVTRTRHPLLCEARWFAEHGFAVVVADGRGTPGRGPAWEKAVHGDTLGPVIEDQLAALRAAARHCPDLDTNRVAIRGWSYGGTLATAAVLRHPDVFHAAIAGAAPSDQRLYDAHWRERFLGHPDDNPTAYDRCSPVNEAAELRRPLLLIHGLADDNVVAAHTLRLSAALLAAGRPHRVLPLPGVTHGTMDEDTTVRLLEAQLAFLEESLGVTAPADGIQPFE